MRLWSREGSQRRRGRKKKGRETREKRSRWTWSTSLSTDASEIHLQMQKISPDESWCSHQLRAGTESQTQRADLWHSGRRRGWDELREEH